jgi:hypothetical protein
MFFLRSLSRAKSAAPYLASWIVVAVVAGTLLPVLVSSVAGDQGSGVASHPGSLAATPLRVARLSSPGLVSIAAFSAELRSTGLLTGPAGSVTYGTAVDYFTAYTAALSVSTSYSGGGWTPWFVVGFANGNTTFLPLPKGTTSCPVTWIETQPAGGALVLPPTSPSAPPGTSAGWGFVLGQASGSTLLFDAVVNGTGTLILTLPSDCFRLSSDQAIPAGVVNSTTAAAAAGAAGGSSFLAEFPNANRTYELISNSTNLSTPNIWVVVYTTPRCENDQEGVFEAAMDALSGTVVAKYTSTSACAFPVEFEETGLVNGTNWAVAVNGTNYGATAPAPIAFDLPNGSYTFAVTAPSGYAATPSSGPFTVSGAPMLLPVAFALLAGNFTVTFTEHGVPNGSALWEVTLRNASSFYSFGVSNGGTSVSFAEPNGTYNYTIDVQMSGWAALPSSGELTVAGANATVLFAFVPGFGVSFAESGLPPGTPWSVNVNGTVYSAEGAEINFTEPNGTFAFTVDAITGFTAAPAAGSVVVNGAAVLQSIAFALEPGYYVLTFTEHGLPHGTPWVVNLRNSSGFYNFGVSNGRTSVSFGEPNDSYTYSVDIATSGWGPSPDSGSVAVVGANVTVLLRFAPGFVVTFAESGLSPGTFWSVTLNGSESPTTGSQINYTEPNGSYSFTVQVPSGYLAVPAIGSLSVNGAAVIEPVVFTPMSASSTVTFTEAGLPLGTLWWVNLTVEPSLNSTTTMITTALPNGSYTYTVASANREFAASGGTFTVNGTAVPVSVAFALVTFEVAFQETGLPSGTPWWVNGTVLGSIESTGTEITFNEPNGTYEYSVATADKEYAPGVASSSLDVNGALVSEPVSFALVTYPVTLTESGLLSGTEWWVNITGQSALSSAVATISTSLPNGSYTYTVATLDKRYVATGGSFQVNGAAVSKSVTFSLVTYVVTFTETGLPSGSEWWVNGTLLGSHSSVTIAIVVNEPNGSYPYTVATSDKEYASAGGSVAVSGSAAPKSVTFSLVTYAVSFKETGLPPGTNWSVGLGGVSHYATGTTVTFNEPNGSYSFTPENVSGYTVSPSSVPIHVHGAGVLQAVTFTPPSKAATLLGLPLTEAYALIGGIFAVAVLAGVTAALLRKRGEKDVPPSQGDAPPAGGPPGAS